MTARRAVLAGVAALAVAAAYVALRQGRQAPPAGAVPAQSPRSSGAAALARPAERKTAEAIATQPMNADKKREEAPAREELLRIEVFILGGR